MAGPGKEAFVADGAAFLMCLFESVLLDVADGLHKDANAETNDSQDICGFVESRLWVLSDLRAVKYSHWHADRPDLNTGGC